MASQCMCPTLVQHRSRRAAAGRRVHLARVHGPACGAPHGELLAVSAHGDDIPGMITCRDCKTIVEHGCTALTILTV